MNPSLVALRAIPLRAAQTAHWRFIKSHWTFGRSPTEAKTVYTWKPAVGRDDSDHGQRTPACRSHAGFEVPRRWAKEIEWGPNGSNFTKGKTLLLKSTAGFFAAPVVDETAQPVRTRAVLPRDPCKGRRARTRP